MASPQKYAAWTRLRRRDAECDRRFLELFKIDTPASFPVAAAMNNIPIETKYGSVESALATAFENLKKERKLPQVTPPEDEEVPGKFINSWYAKRIRGGILERNLVYVYVENPDDPPKEWRKKFVQEGWIPRYRESTFMHLQTAWKADYQFGFAEEKAHKKLRELIEPFEYERYLLTGVIVFVGKGGVQYMIRKGKPTLSFRIVPSETKEGESTFRPLAAMCTHSAGYFSRTWASFLPPTDDVITHLLLLRRGEHEFWKRCQQHHFDEVEACI